MKIKERLPALIVIAVLVLGAGIVASRFFPSSKDTALVDVRVPTLSAAALRGKTLYDANCAQCHGVNAAGSDRGPPFVHEIYNPGHHADIAFQLAVKQGVRAHHWRFGNMPPQPQVSESDVAAIVRYVRELQTANGIVYKLHTM